MDRLLLTPDGLRLAITTDGQGRERLMLDTPECIGQCCGGDCSVVVQFGACANLNDVGRPVVSVPNPYPCPEIVRENPWICRDALARAGVPETVGSTIIIGGVCFTVPPGGVSVAQRSAIPIGVHVYGDGEFARVPAGCADGRCQDDTGRLFIRGEPCAGSTPAFPVYFCRTAVTACGVVCVNGTKWQVSPSGTVVREVDVPPGAAKVSIFVDSNWPYRRCCTPQPGCLDGCAETVIRRDDQRCALNESRVSQRCCCTNRRVARVLSFEATQTNAGGEPYRVYVTDPGQWEFDENDVLVPGSRPALVSGPGFTDQPLIPPNQCGLVDADALKFPPALFGFAQSPQFCPVAAGSNTNPLPGGGRSVAVGLQILRNCNTFYSSGRFEVYDAGETVPRLVQEWNFAFEVVYSGLCSGGCAGLGVDRPRRSEGGIIVPGNPGTGGLLAPIGSDNGGATVTGSGARGCSECGGEAEWQ